MPKAPAQRHFKPHQRARHSDSHQPTPAAKIRGNRVRQHVTWSAEHYTDTPSHNFKTTLVWKTDSPVAFWSAQCLTRVSAQCLTKPRASAHCFTDLRASAQCFSRCLDNTWSGHCYITRYPRTYFTTKSSLKQLTTSCKSRDTYSRKYRWRPN